VNKPYLCFFNSCETVYCQYQWIKIKKMFEKNKKQVLRRVCKISVWCLCTYLFILFKLVIHIWYIGALFIHIYWGKSSFFLSLLNTNYFNIYIFIHCFDTFIFYSMYWDKYYFYTYFTVLGSNVIGEIEPSFHIVANLDCLTFRILSFCGGFSKYVIIVILDILDYIFIVSKKHKDGL